MGIPTSRFGQASKKLEQIDANSTPMKCHKQQGDGGKAL